MYLQGDSNEITAAGYEASQAVGPNSKAILTCRSEHFEFAKAASKTFRGEGAPTFSPEPLALLEPPRFEILSLAKLSPVQVEEIVVKREGASRGTTLARKIQDVPALADLAGRAVAIELIIAALPSLDEAKVDLARVFLYATRELLVRNIREKRSFTSMADKVHFLCELAWQMLSTGELKLHFTQFPDHIRQYRPELKDREIDHWKFDLGGQTLIVRDDDGNYSFSQSTRSYELVPSLSPVSGSMSSFVQPRSTYHLSILRLCISRSSQSKYLLKSAL
jgi:hypothetical protein